MPRHAAQRIGMLVLLLALLLGSLGRLNYTCAGQALTALKSQGVDVSGMNYKPEVVKITPGGK